MSTAYVLEPPTKGKVVVHTTYGPIDVELWPKEAPKAVRNFIQLCLEGYYDNTIFHRIIKTFLIQGGDPTGTGTGGESIYGSPFSDEIHSRLRFKHRGLVACANAGTPNSNGSQFFVSLDRCDWLDKMHTIFGKVTGDSIYNLLRLGEVETGKDDRPLDPAPMIISTEVLWNPFEDIVPRRQPATLSSSVTEADKGPKKKPVKKLNLLSFGEEAEEEEKSLAAVKTKIKSSHDVLDDPRLLKNENSSDAKITRDVQLSVREALNSKKEERKIGSEAKFPNSFDNSDDDDEASFDARMRLQILKKQSEFKEVPPSKQKSKKSNSSRKEQREHLPSRSDDDDDGDDGPSVEKLSLKKKGMGSEARAEHMDKADSDLQLFNETERQRQLLKMKKRRRQGHEAEMLAKLENFKSSISTKPVESTGKSTSGGGEEDLSDWSKVELKFATETGKGKMTRKDDPNDYVVHDPLLEKGKEKFNKMMAKQKRKGREWAGKSLT
ncbi:peptidyl-prolyl cis-trans isomerase CYP57 [Impatiens glandulifera]|uniref:peptidyl-prolyl cis-trans isomerase CYP57 n=1 Tax=Impatiens glandulifera TaxID=253017 RepID=UPI001FB1742C|nr:peptidyl-prolyl cis-trans isomerase CYP57 [Impatiens glandulifera]